ncbi:MAG: orotidine-5'-phosphate decarboxylase [Mariprofundaceae bacterium]
MRERLMVALDLPDDRAARTMAGRLAGHVGWFKVGLRLFVAAGPGLVRELAASAPVFLDLKFHDIPNTVAQAVESAGRLGVRMVNVHAAGGEAMLRAAAGAARDFPDMRLIAVTVLTSDPMPKEQALALALERARMARDCGLDGVVCSAFEAGDIKRECGPAFLTVTPGIRWGGQARDDQQRVAGPDDAVRMGADFLVVGRPILAAADPAAAADEAVALMRAAQ